MSKRRQRWWRHIPKIRLLWFLLACLAVGTLAGVMGRRVQQHPQFHYKAKNFEGGQYCGMWREDRKGERLVYLLLIPKHVTYQSETSCWPGQLPSIKNISCLPEGLFLDGEAAEIDDTRRVFVYTLGRKLRPVVSTKEHLKQVRRDQFDRLPQSNLWKKTIAPVFEEEAARARRALVSGGPPEAAALPTRSKGASVADGGK